VKTLIKYLDVDELNRIASGGLIKEKCCFLGCEKAAEWLVVTGNTADGYTYSCSEHLGDMIGSDQAAVFGIGDNWEAGKCDESLIPNAV
jgi:hypothetical protein